MTKTPDQTRGYYAIRRGKNNMKACIFLFWDDCKQYVEGYDDAEYSVFDKIEEALAYVGSESTNTVIGTINNNNEEDTAPPLGDPLDDEPEGGTGGGGIFNDADNNSTTIFNNQTTTTTTPQQQQQSQTNNNSSTANVDDGSKPPPPPSLPPWSRSGDEVAAAVSVPTTQVAAVATASAAATKQARAKSAVENAMKAMKQLPTQSSSSSKKRQRSSLTTKAKVTNNATTSSNKKPKRSGPQKPNQKWQDSFNSLRAYMETHGGSSDVPKDDKDHEEIRKFIYRQRQYYTLFRDGTDDNSSPGITEEKINLLVGIGFDFKYMSWADGMDQLRQYKEEHNNLDVPAGGDNVELVKWMKKQRQQIKLYEKGESCIISLHQINQLIELGFAVDRDEKRKKESAERNTKADEENFEEMFKEVVEYKTIHGNCDVPQKPATPLARWVMKQRLQYKKLREGKSTYLTASRMQRLTDIGFVFNPKGRIMSWSERMEKLKAFKAIHGHVRVPRMDPEMGGWVCRQRREYWNFKEGKICHITQEKIDELTALGFDFKRVGKSIVIKERKPWEERFKELLEFKNQHGHTVVPQTHPFLGEWAHSQRKNYRKYLEGKPSGLNAEKALKLINIGFVFDATSHRGSHKKRVSSGGGTAGNNNNNNNNNQINTQQQKQNNNDDVVPI